MLNKCAHGVYIPERLGESRLSDCCSICQSHNPKLDYRYGKPEAVKVEGKSIAEVHGLLVKTGSPAVYEKLYHIVIRFAGAIARKRFASKWYIPDTRDVIRDAAAHCMMNISKYDPKKSGFSTWAHTCIDNYIKDWLDEKVDWDTWSLDYKDRHNTVPDNHASLDEKIFLKEVKSKLLADELELFELVAAGYSQEDIGQQLGLERRRLGEKWKELTEKIRAMG